MSKLGRQLHSTDTLIFRPHVTERSSMQSFNEEHPVYTFEVAAGANKATVRAAVQKLYGVKPTKVNMVTVPAKKVIVRGKIGSKSGYKKALVFLKKGDKIDFV